MESGKAHERMFPGGIPGSDVRENNLEKRIAAIRTTKGRISI